jgi:HEAT repeat protein
MRLAVALLLVLAAQEPDVQTLIAELRSDTPASREEAFRKLIKLGDSIEAEMRKLTEDRDAEVAARAKKLVHLIETRRRLPANLRSLDPGIETRLAFGEPHEWTDVFRLVIDWPDDRWNKLQRYDLEALAAPALEYATPEEVDTVFDLIDEYRLRTAAAALVKVKTVPPYLSAEQIARLGMRESAIPWLLGLLDHPDFKTRCRAVSLLDNLHAESAGPAVMALLKDPSEDVRESAGDFFWTNECREAVPALLKALQDPVPGVRWFAMEALAEQAPEEALPQILLQAGDTDADVRKYAAWVLEKLPPGKASETALRLLKDSDSDVRERALESIGKWRLRSAFDEVAALLSDKDRDARREAAKALLKIDRERALFVLRGLLKHPDPDIRILAVEWLSSSEDRSSAKEIAAFLDEENRLVRLAAIRALGQLQAAEFASELASRIEASKGSEYKQIIGALENLKSKASVPCLLRLLESDEIKRVEDALVLLGRIGGPEAKAGVFGKLRHEDAGIRFAAARATTYLGDKEAIPELRRLLGDAETSVRGVAIESLGSLRAVEALDDLLSMMKLEPTYANHTSGVIEALGRLKRKEAVPALLPLLHNRFFRTEAFLALAEINDPASYPAMSPLLNDLVHENRITAVRALGRMKSQSLEPAIAALLKDPNDDLRAEAIDAIGRMAGPGAPAAMMEALNDPAEECRDSAVKWLIRLNRKEAIPHLAKKLAHADLDFRSRAADAMCWLGSRDGAETAIVLGKHLTGLNVLRQADASLRLKRMHLKEAVKGTSDKVAALIAQSAGMSVRITLPKNPEEARWMEDTWTLDSTLHEWSCLDLLSIIVEYSPYKAIIERDEIRIIPRGEAIEFWTSWLKETN